MRSSLEKISMLRYLGRLHRKLVESEPSLKMITATAFERQAAVADAAMAAGCCELACKRTPHSSGRHRRNV